MLEKLTATADELVGKLLALLAVQVGGLTAQLLAGECDAFAGAQHDAHEALVHCCALRRKRGVAVLLIKNGGKREQQRNAGGLEELRIEEALHEGPRIIGLPVPRGEPAERERLDLRQLERPEEVAPTSGVREHRLLLGWERAARD